MSPHADLDLAAVIRSQIGRAFGEFLPLEDLPALADRLAALDGVDGALSDGRTIVADARAKTIAAAVAKTSTRAVADYLGLSVAAVAKACARARTPGLPDPVAG